MCSQCNYYMSFQWVDFHSNLVSQRELFCIKNVGVDQLFAFQLLFGKALTFWVSLEQSQGVNIFCTRSVFRDVRVWPNRPKTNWEMMPSKDVSEYPSRREKWKIIHYIWEVIYSTVLSIWWGKEQITLLMNIISWMDFIFLVLLEEVTT